VTVHATHHARVAHNVAYHIRGHTFFVEDGIETNNVFEANLAINTQCSEVRVVWGASASGGAANQCSRWSLLLGASAVFVCAVRGAFAAIRPGPSSTGVLLYHDGVCCDVMCSRCAMT
jgi:hypothetical protein